MEKKPLPRQPSLTNSNAIEKKTDSSPNKFVRFNKRRDHGNGRGAMQDFSIRGQVSQKSRSTLDKRPRSRGCFTDRQREEVARPDSFEVGSAFYHGSKKGNLNHLLNFTFAARENVVGSSHRPQARRTRVTYNKEQYLQANCQFVVKNTGDYTVQAKNADALVEWDLVEQVITFSHDSGTCPICLHVPSAGKITRCGHVYCWACILHYLSLDDRTWRKCPICFESVHTCDLRSVKIIQRNLYTVGDTITFQLMKRGKGSTYAMPCGQWQDKEDQHQRFNDGEDNVYAKVLVADATQIQTSVIEEERRALKDQLLTAEPSEVCFIESALAYLDEREAVLQGKVNAEQVAVRHMKQLEEARQQEEHPLTNHFVGAQDRLLKKACKHYIDAFDEDYEEAEEDATCSIVSEEISEEEEEDFPVCSVGLTDDHRLDAKCSNVECTKTDKMADQSYKVPDMPTSSEVAGAMAEGQEQAACNDTGVHNLANINKSKDAFYFYQAIDGQHIYLHSLNARCIISQYGSLEHGPTTITATIVDKEIAFMTENIRRRLRYLSHLPLTCEFQVLEVSLGPPIISKHTLQLFTDEFKKRSRQRQKRVREDKRQARKLQIEERKTYGLYPELRLSLDNPEHFPAPPVTAEELQLSLSLSDDSRDVGAFTDPPGPTTCMAETVPKGNEDATNEQTSFSFAAALKKAKQPSPAVFEGRHKTSVHSAATSSSSKLLPHEKTCNDSDEETHVPLFSESFGEAIQKALDTLESGNTVSNSKKTSGKKKKEKKLLFSTSMMRR